MDAFIGAFAAAGRLFQPGAVTYNQLLHVLYVLESNNDCNPKNRRSWQVLPPAKDLENDTTTTTQHDELEARGEYEGRRRPLLDIRHYNIALVAWAESDDHTAPRRAAPRRHTIPIHA